MVIIRAISNWKVRIPIEVSDAPSEEVEPKRLHGSEYHLPPPVSRLFLREPFDSPQYCAFCGNVHIDNPFSNSAENLISLLRETVPPSEKPLEASFFWHLRRFGESAPCCSEASMCRQCVTCESWKSSFGNWCSALD